MSNRDIISKTNQFGRVVTLTFREGLQHIEAFMNSEFGLGFSLGLDYSYKQNCFEIEVYKLFKDLWYRAWGMNLGFFR